jgi:hypothetical protein
MPANPRRAPGDAADAQAAIERFLEAARNPALLEPGEDLLSLSRNNFVCEARAGRVTIQAWDERRNLSRRVSAIHSETAGKLELIIERFPRKEGTLLLVDLGRPSNQEWARRSARMVFRERFRLMLNREFPEWSINELSSEPDLEHSLSPVYPRALLTEGQRAMAAIACPPEPGDSGVLTFGLIWFDYLRRRERRRALEALCVFVPAAQAAAVALRLQCLNPRAARFMLYAYSEQTFAAAVDPRDAGNIDTVLEPCRRPVGDAALAQALARSGEVEQIVRNDGEISFRVRGLEFARTEKGSVLFGLDERRPLREHNLEEACRLAREIGALRQNGGHLSAQGPELWLESQVRKKVEEIDASLLGAPIYGQVPAFAGGERGVLDLLAVDRTGRLAVIELKASSDLHLPMQALDYWARVKWHIERGEFGPSGYFPGLQLRPEPPRLLLVAPALEFHPTTETILRYFAPDIDVERIGLALEWRTKLQVMFRARGAACA